MEHIDKIRKNMNSRCKENYNYQHNYLLKVLSETLEQRTEYEEKKAILKWIQDLIDNNNYDVDLCKLIINSIRNNGDRSGLQIKIYDAINDSRPAIRKFKLSCILENLEEEYLCSGYWRG
jgi:hypothetical protein